jgi:hypothetical protein
MWGDRTGADPTLLAAALRQAFGTVRTILGDEERSYPDRSVKLVCRQAQQIDTEGSHIHCDLSGGLSCVGMERHALRAANLSDLADRLKDTDFVVRSHHRDEGRPIRYRRSKLREVD